jgi:hypothetical protein
MELSFFKKNIKKGTLNFFNSIFLGIFIWVFFFIITPIGTKSNSLPTTLCFIFFSYLFLILGYYLPPLSITKKKQYIIDIEKALSYQKVKILYCLIILIIFSFFFRYYDLFINRELSFYNSPLINKRIASNPKNFSLFFGSLSIFRTIYFVPLIFYFNYKIRKNEILIVCLFLFLFPILEAYLRDSRRIIFELLILLLIILFLFKKINLKSYKTYLVIFIVFLLFAAYSMTVTERRVKLTGSSFYEKIYTSPYNDFVPVKKEAMDFISINGNNIISKAYFSEIHIGQYINHGVFEMGYMIFNLKEHKYGLYNSYLIIKFLNKIKLTNISLEHLNNPSDRNTYITFFGGMFLDFGWVSLPLMFLFGYFQKLIFYLGNNTFVFKPIMVVLYFSNIFLLVMNFIRAQFLLTIGVYLIFLLILALSMSLLSNRIKRC